jgi:hypothetical protein
MSEGILKPFAGKTSPKAIETIEIILSELLKKSPRLEDFIRKIATQDFAKNEYVDFAATTAPADKHPEDFDYCAVYLSTHNPDSIELVMRHALPGDAEERIIYIETTVSGDRAKLGVTRHIHFDDDGDTDRTMRINSSAEFFNSSTKPMDQRAIAAGLEVLSAEIRKTEEAMFVAFDGAELRALTEEDVYL